jgi:DNA repair exonuclease SbcCD ATPase subunit
MKDARDQLIGKLEELVEILKRQVHVSGLLYPPSKVLKDINRLEELESEISALKKQIEEVERELLSLERKDVEDLVRNAYQRGYEDRDFDIGYGSNLPFSLEQIDLKVNQKTNVIEAKDYDENYLQECIEKAKPNLSKIKDVDKALDEIRGNSDLQGEKCKCRIKWPDDNGHCELCKKLI